MNIIHIPGVTVKKEVGRTWASSNNLVEIPIKEKESIVFKKFISNLNFNFFKTQYTIKNHINAKKDRKNSQKTE